MSLPKLFERIFWHNNTTPAVNETNLNAMSKGLSDVDDRLISLGGLIIETVPEIQQDMEILGPAVESIDDNVARAEAAAESAEQYAEEIAPPIEVVKDYADIITIEDAINKAAKDLKVKIEPVQDLHGYDKPWVGGAGKNLFPSNKNPDTYLANQFTIDMLDNGYKLTSITTADWVSAGWTIGDASAFAGKSVTFKALGTYSGSAHTSRVRLAYVPTSGTEVAAAADLGSFCTVNVPSGASGIIEARLYLAYGTALTVGASTTFYNIQLEVGNTATTYEPYTNICPITGWTEANIARSGKNEIDIVSRTITTSNGIDKINCEGCTATRNGQTLTTTITGTWSKLQFKFDGNLLKDGETYTFSAVYDNPSQNNIMLVYRYDGANWIIPKPDVTTKNVRLEIQFTYNASLGRYLIFGCAVNNSGTNTNNTVVVSNIMLEHGESATEFKPFTDAKLYIIDLDGTRYGGTLDVTSGVLTLTHGETDAGTLTYQRLNTVTTGKYRFGATLPSSAKRSDTTNGVHSKCSHYELLAQGGTGNATTYGYTIGGDSDVLFYDGRFATYTAEQFKTAISGVQIVYELATPQTISLTPTEVELLLGYNTLWADTGDLSLTYDASGVLRIANAKLDIDTFKSVVAASSDFADFKTRVAAL